MSHWKSPTRTSIKQDRLLLIVVGAHLEAENAHRPLAYRMMQAMRDWLDQPEEEDLGHRRQAVDHPLVCSDLWYVNNSDLFDQPVVSIGPPGFNAATAMLAVQLPPAFVIDKTVQILMDVEQPMRGVCLWGSDTRATSAAVDVFLDRYLDGFLRAAMDHSGTV